MSPEELKIVWKLRRVLTRSTQQAIELLLNKLRETKSNYEFLMQVQKTTAGARPAAPEDAIGRRAGSPAAGRVPARRHRAFGTDAALWRHWPVGRFRFTSRHARRGRPGDRPTTTRRTP